MKKWRKWSCNWLITLNTFHFSFFKDYSSTISSAIKYTFASRNKKKKNEQYTYDIPIYCSKTRVKFPQFFSLLPRSFRGEKKSGRWPKRGEEKAREKRKKKRSLLQQQTLGIEYSTGGAWLFWKENKGREKYAWKNIF